MPREDGLDTALARLLHQRGLVDLQTLQKLVEEVRARRAQEPGATLAALLCERQLVPEDILQHSLQVLCGDETIVDRATTGEQLSSAPKSIGHYQVVRELARGGMGVVYEVIDPGSGAHYALKTILTVGFSGNDADGELARFRREAEVLASLDHPHIVKVHAANLEEGGTPYLVQDLLPGGTLQARLSEGPLPVDEAVSLTATLADALEHAHVRGVLHRDLKPLNVLFDDRGAPRLVDFGLALDLAAKERLTQTGELMGTPGYLAPEQAQAEKAVDARTDVYGLGAVLYALLTGEPPFRGFGLAALARVVHDPPPALRDRCPLAPLWLEEVVAKALAKRPEDRFPSAAAFGAALHDKDDVGAPRRAGRRVAVLAAIALCCVGVAIAAWFLSKPSAEQADSALEQVEADARHAARVAISLRDLERDLNEWAATLAEYEEYLAPERRDSVRAQLAVLRGLVALSRSEHSAARRELELATRGDSRVYALTALRGGVALIDSRVAPAESAHRDLSDALRRGVAAWEVRSWRAQSREAAGLTSALAREELRADLEALATIEAADLEVHRRLALELQLAARRPADARKALTRLSRPDALLAWRVALLEARERFVKGNVPQTLKALSPPGQAPHCAELLALAKSVDAALLEAIPPPRGAGGMLTLAPSNAVVTAVRKLLEIRARLLKAPLSSRLREDIHSIAADYTRVENTTLSIALSAYVGDLFPDDYELQACLAMVSIRGTSASHLVPATKRAVQLATHPTERFRLEVVAAWLLCTKDVRKVDWRAGIAWVKRLRTQYAEQDARGGFVEDTDLSLELRMVGPVLARLWASQAQAHHLLGEHVESLACHREAEAHSTGGDAEAAHAAQIHELHELGRDEEAIARAEAFVHRRGLTRDPSSGVALEALWGAGRESARELLAEALWSYQPQTDRSRGWWVRLALIEAELGRSERAEEALREAALAFERGRREEAMYKPLPGRARALASRLAAGEDVLSDLRTFLDVVERVAW